MIISDCFWEIENIGKKTVEIVIEEKDTFDSSSIFNSTLGYEYSVVKVPMNNPRFNIGLSEMGYSCIESQINLFKSYDDFDFSKVKNQLDDTDFDVVNNVQAFNSVISMISPGMFSTDRVSIDPSFGVEIGYRRYVNWITTEYKKGTAQLIRILYQRQHVGFMLVKLKDDTIQLLLNGLYKPYQKKGLGILTPASPMMFVRKNSSDILYEKTSISSNNIPVVKLYNKLHFQVESQMYVFVKHVFSEK